ncbi:hypothetical protein DC522_15555 [Microvirga sp. KLBC 81]|uniref:hypothetical protein n=1 Tax=Microvirga sp. KLBC 81 TaxID=1862707 RepID=UPI000D50D1A5|nr:hypothetical protein [Microvirga sp. KLBC 81]PVE23424.1 hypothetical protein DC522_15555 [Microvirga sp. KLBC 81]
MTSVQQLALARSSARDCTYNLFRNKQLPAILCAVPEDRPVPKFLDAGQWTFERPLRPSNVRPPGFHDRAAYAGVRYNGFYLFQVTATQEKMAG